MFFSDNFGSESNASQASGATGGQINNLAVKKRFKEFLREFHESNFNYKYRDTLKRNYNLGQYWVDVNLEDLSSFDDALADRVNKSPSELVPLFEESATEVADEVTAPRPEGEEEVQKIQVMLNSEGRPASMRDLSADVVSQLVKVPGIVVSASGVKAKATRISIQCRSCRTVVPNIDIRPGLEGYAMPRKCNTEQAGRPKCPLDPFFIMPDKCRCVDFQMLKLQEAPDSVPHGEMPRHMSLYVDRFLCDKVVPGNRITVQGIYSIRKSGGASKTGNKRERGTVGVRAPYVRVLGIQVETEGIGRASKDVRFTAQEEEEFRRLAAKPNVHEILAKSIAPSIYGSDDIKKVVASLLFGGSRKILPDGLARRGDINVLLLGDPGTAKSQLLKVRYDMHCRNCVDLNV